MICNFNYVLLTNIVICPLKITIQINVKHSINIFKYKPLSIGVKTMDSMLPRLIAK